MGKHHITKIAILVLVSSLVACSSVPLTPAGMLVKPMRPDQVATCKYLASEEINDSSFGAYPGICEKRARDSMRNRVAALGGNAYVQTYVSIFPCTMGGTTISFEAYSCPEQ